MIKSVLSRSLIAALLVGASNAALAADLDNIIYAPELPRTVPVEVGNGWYLRGDVSYDFSTSGDATSFRSWDFNTSTEGPAVGYSSSSFETDWGVGLGLGYQFTNWLRGEAMLNYQRGTFSATSSSAAVPCTGLLADGCDTSGAADFESYGLMANGYVDLGTYSGFTPYVGAGAGLTLVDYDSYVASETCVGACPGGTTPVTVSHAGQADWRFTYALMAGVSYEFVRNLKADLGYRYTNVGSGDIYGFDSVSAAAGATGVQSSDNGYSTHAVTASLRYALW
ncbi:outer membrane protein [Hoeflea poritis]|uniref:Outer membrane beta-barrel protein n=1 Tax=Hoeflea poritis TaxID=2993659 RepID=A0ABT4VT49_9HYPH|nr:outer membrane beta-barrel protein [Hoeflea poritis]MDA4847892.1 outer membrane beta-barrel protein [Hoeflea poritis]